MLSFLPREQNRFFSGPEEKQGNNKRGSEREGGEDKEQNGFSLFSLLHLLLLIHSFSSAPSTPPPSALFSLECMVRLDKTGYQSSRDHSM